VRFRNALDYLVYLAVRLLICAIQALSIEACQAIAGHLATLFAHVLRIRRRVVEENLRRAFPEISPGELRRLTWCMWEHLFLMVMEIALARRKINATNWRQYVRLVDEVGLVRGLLDRRPTVLVTAHYGNFELAGYLLGMFGFPTVTVARTLDNRFLDRFVNDFRSSTGQYMVAKHGTAGLLDDFLRRGAKLTLLGDQAAGRKGCWVDFFGHPASTHKAIALFALSSEAPMMVVFARRFGGPLQFETGLAAMANPATDGGELNSVPGLTQWFTAQLERVVREAPEQYWWVHRRWKGEPPKRKRKARVAARPAEGCEERTRIPLLAGPTAPSRASR